MAVNLVTYINVEPSDELGIDDIPAKPPLLNTPEVEGRIICFYGFKPVVKSMKQVRLDAAKSDKKVTRFSIKVESDYDARGTLKTLHQEKAISIWRADKLLREKITDILRDKLGARYKGVLVVRQDIDDLFEMEPELFNILWEHPDFAHINVFLWRGKYNCSEQLGIIRSKEAIEGIDITL
jgi:hypothetical protein